MAEFGAHLTSTASGDADQPDIFEALAQESLMKSLKPAMSHILRVIAETNPNRYGWLYRLQDEVYAVIDFILQSYCLKRYDASFSENFYSLKRSPINENVIKLSKSQKLKSLIFLMLIPYFKDKCDKKFEEMKEKYPNGREENQSLIGRLRLLFTLVYPHIHLLYEGVILCCHLMYALGKLGYHTPWLPLAGVHLKHLSEDDILSQQVHMPTLNFANKNFMGKCCTLVRYGLGSLALGVSSVVSVGVFFLQFLEWWYSSDQHATSLTALPVPPPPQKEVSHPVPVIPTLCPLCQRSRTNDTALAVSGYVFCYPCIYRYISKNGRCPVTGYPALTDHIVRLYQPQSS